MNLRYLILVFGFIYGLYQHNCQAQSIDEINPGYCFAGKSLTVNISGNNTRFAVKPGLTKIKFTSGTYIYVPQSIKIISDTRVDIIANFPNNAPTGMYSLTIEDSIDVRITKQGAINVIEAGKSTLLSVYPDSIRHGQSRHPLYINGLNTIFNYEFGKPKVWLQKGKSILKTTSTAAELSKTHIVAFPEIPLYVPSGYYDVYVHDSFDSTIVYSNGIYISDHPASVIKNASPDLLKLGQVARVIISGNYCNFDNKTSSAKTIALVMGNKDSIAADSATGISPDSLYAYFTVPYTSDTGRYSISVHTADEAPVTGSNKMHIIHNYEHKIATYSPHQGELGENISFNLLAINFNFASGQAGIWLSKDSEIIYPLQAGITGNGTMYGNFRIPLDATPGKWDVNAHSRSDGQLTVENGFTIPFPSKPIITGVYPDTLIAENYTTLKIKALNTIFTSHSIFEIQDQHGAFKYLPVDKVISPTELLSHIRPDFQLPPGRYVLSYYDDRQAGYITWGDRLIINPKSAINNSDYISLMNEASLYPNPCRDGINLKINPEPGSKVLISLSNAIGKRLYFKQYDVKSPGSRQIFIDLREIECSTGFYILSISNGTSEKNFKVYKMK